MEEMSKRVSVCFKMSEGLKEKRERIYKNSVENIKFLKRV